LSPSAGTSAGGKLENRLAIVERKQELAEEAQKAKAEKAANVEIGKKGLSIASADKQFSMKLNGYAQVDNRAFLGGSVRGDSEFLARRLRPTLTMQAWKDFSLRLMPDFAGSSTRIFDAHADYRYSDSLQFRIGKFKPPVSLERLQSAADMMFAERGHPNSLAPSRDYGVMVYGEPLPELEYQLAVFNGNADLGNSDDDADNHKDVVARVFTLPFKQGDNQYLKQFGIGLAGSYGERSSTTTTTQLPTYRTPGQLAYFTYGTGVHANGEQWRLYPQAYYYYNSLGILAEYAISSQELKVGAVQDSFEHHAWQVAASYLLTGEDANFKGAVKPNADFNPANGTWGAFEVVGRVGQIDFDDDMFPTFASLATSPTQATSYGTGLNWHFNENFKLITDYEYTTFKFGATAGDRADEHVVITRAQFRF
jgi:phosphate-selective porin OprO and OprP